MNSILPTTHRKNASNIIASSSRYTNQKQQQQQKIGELYQPELYGFVISDPSTVRWANWSAIWRTCCGLILLPLIVLLVLLVLTALGITFTSFF